MKRVLSIVVRTPPQEQLNPQLLKSSIVSLARWAYRFSPVVALDRAPRELENDPRFVGINLDVSGCERLFHGDEALLRKMSEGISLLGIRARMALAPTLGVAWAVSRHGPNRVSLVPAEGIRHAVAALPIRALRVPEKTVRELREVNVCTIDQLLALPPPALRSRFPALLVQRLYQLQGWEDEPLKPLTFRPDERSYVEFTGPVTDLQVVQESMKRALHALCDELEVLGRKISLLRMELGFSLHPSGGRNEKFVKELPLSFASLDREHLWSLLSLQVERLQLGEGIESILLVAAKSERIVSSVAAHEELASPSELLPETLAPETQRRFGGLLDILSEHLGETRVCRAEQEESHIPEKSFCYVPIKGAGPRRRTRPLDVERPSILFMTPRPLRVMAVMPDSPPFWLEWQKQRLRVVYGEGPERIAPEWWGRDSTLCHTRDYFKVQVASGSWLWIFRELRREEWFVHGIWT